MNLHEERLSGKHIFKGRVIDLEVDQIRLPDGHDSIREVINHPGGVAIAALNERDELLMVRQFRYAQQEVLLELPAGAIEKGEDPKVAAGRELLEETGYQAGHLEFLMKTAPNAANSTAYAYCYLATDAEWVAAQHLDAMEDVAVEFMDVKDARRALRKGTFEQAVHVAALYAALDILEGREKR